MAEVQAHVNYDFDGQAADGELTIYAGEILTILRRDVGDGWWEARNAAGNTGLVPEAYLEIMSAPEPSMPPPPPPVAVVNNQPNSYSTSPDSYDGQYQQQTSAAPTAPTESYDDDWGDDDWDDDESTTADEDAYNNSMHYAAGHMKNGRIDSTSQGGHFVDRQNKFGGTVRKGISRFSTFAKSGGEAYLLGENLGSPTDLEKVTVVDSQYGPIWTSTSSPYTCVIASPKKSTKFHGMKSFIAYQLTPSFSNIQVSRRYKHFDWLYKVMIEKFPCISIPPLPDKQVTGRYEDDFISERMKQLQFWVNRMVRHPVVSNSNVFMHFLNCTDEKRWKIGKRNAEKDEFIGAKFFVCVQTPAAPFELQQIENQVEHFNKFTKSMDDNVKQLISVGDKNVRNHHGPFKREFTRLGITFSGLASTFDLDTGGYSKGLTEAIRMTGRTYGEIGDLFKSQPPKDMLPLIDVLYEYKGVLAGFPDLIQTHKSATAKVKECQKSKDEGKMTESEVQAVESRCDTVSYAILAESTYFQQERVHDFKVSMQQYLVEQIEFYKKITAKLESALQRYDTV